MLRAAHDLFAYAFDGNVWDSRVRLTTPVGPAQPDFCNAAILVRTDAPPEALLSIAMRIEQQLGRVREERWGPRTIDVDVLWIEGESYESDSLVVPHARLRERAFALAPLLDVAPDASDPRTGESYSAILALQGDKPLEGPYALDGAFDTVEVLDHTADEGFVVTALDRADLLAASAEALGNIIVHRSSVRPMRVLPVSVDAPEGGWEYSEDRLYGWLSEVLFTLDARRFAARRVCVLEDSDERVRGLLLGEPLDESRHEVGTAVKAITYHDMSISQCERGPRGEQVRARVIVDV